MYLGLAGGLFATSALLAGAYFVLGGDAQAAGTPRKAPASDARAADPGDLGTLVGRQLDAAVEVVIAGKPVAMRWSDLGVVVDEDDLAHAARRAASDEPLASLRDAGALPLRVDRARAIAALTTLKGRYDRAAVDARLDLEAREIRADEPGFGIDVYASLPRIESGARAGVARLELAGVPLPARVTKAGLGIDDISHVMGHWTTKFSVSDKDRNFNLKLAASKINGKVLAPGETFSFNEVVGNRTEKEGYKIAHVITAGEMVDGLAGGTCQISTTLFAASFFAGLEIVDTTPHSRPSAYQPFGFDATVVWPNTDLVLRNGYDFPVAIHYVVARGEATVEVLGHERPYDEVTFERKILEESDYVVQERPDDTMPEGTEAIVQPGFPGYRITRYRKFYKNGKQVKEEHWNLNYKPVTEYVRKGTNTDPTLEVPPPPAVHELKPPSDGTGRIKQ
ncbi:MAG: VanW family protein [Myxococcales bacterium]|nr:VanW family protein [Myxococcales bacterium]